MDVAQKVTLVAFEPTSWQGLLEGGLTMVGLGTTTAFLLWLVFRAWLGWRGQEMPVDAKIACALFGPALVGTVIYGLLVVTTAVPWSKDVYAGVLLSGGQMGIAGQGVYAATRMVQVVYERLHALWAGPGYVSNEPMAGFPPDDRGGMMDDVAI